MPLVHRHRYPRIQKSIHHPYPSIPIKVRVEVLCVIGVSSVLSWDTEADVLVAFSDVTWSVHSQKID